MDLSGLSDDELKAYAALLLKRQEFEHLSAEDEKRLEDRARLTANPATFFREAWRVLEPTTKLEWSWHYDLIGEWLQAAYKRQVKRLIFTVPPRTSKSTYITITFPAQCWMLDPSLRFLTASYSSALSRDHSVKRRSLIESPWYQRYAPIQLVCDTNRADQYRNTATGEMISTSVGATGTGRGGNFLLLDDGLSADQARSEADRKTAHEWFANTFRTRLNDPANDVIIIIEQRTHDEDVTGWVLKNEPDQWEHVNVPLEWDQKPTHVVFPSGRTQERLTGDVLQPSRHTPEVVASLKLYGRTFATQYQGRPAPEGGTICKREWWQYYKAVPEDFDQVIDSWDFSFKDSKETDFVSGFKVGIKGAKRYFLNNIHGRMGFVASRDAAVRLATMDPVSSRRLVEDKANGPAIIDSLKNKLSGIIPIEPQGSKEARAYAASADIEAGNVLLPDVEKFPQHRVWVNRMIEEWAMFPNGANDDDVDASGQAINHTRKTSSSFTAYYAGMNEEAKQKDEVKQAATKAKQSQPARQWSDSIRTLAMGIPPVEVDPVELEEWISFLHGQGDTERAAFAECQRKPQTGGSK